MGRNHIMDVHHRVSVNVKQISFTSIDELSRLMYAEGSTIPAQTYMGNINHNKVSQRLKAERTYRIIDGIDRDNFIKLWEEEYGKNN